MRKHMALAALAALLVLVLPIPADAGGANGWPLQAGGMGGVTQSCVALTFDDGPDLNLTPKLLSTLEQKGVRATFFLIGYKVAAGSSIVLREQADGDVIGNHSWSHPLTPNLTGLASSTVQAQISQTDDVILQLTKKVPVWIRAPGGYANQAVIDALALVDRDEEQNPRHFVAWAVDPKDWLDPGAQVVVERVLSKVYPGAIVLMHDTHKGTIEAVPYIIDGLVKQGYRLVTVSQLLGGECGGSVLNYDKLNVP